MAVIVNNVWETERGLKELAAGHGNPFKLGVKRRDQAKKQWYA